MKTEIIQHALGWCAVLNIGLLLYWLVLLKFAHEWVYRFHSRWFELSRQTFDAIHYAGMAFYKICIFLFNLTPYLVLRFLT